MFRGHRVPGDPKTPSVTPLHTALNQDPLWPRKLDLCMWCPSHVQGSGRGWVGVFHEDWEITVEGREGGRGEGGDKKMWMGIGPRMRLRGLKSGQRRLVKQLGTMSGGCKPVAGPLGAGRSDWQG